MSASMAAVSYPSAAKVAARLALTDDLPTPPLPEAIAKMRVLTPGLLNGFCLRSALRPATRSASLSWLMDETSMCGVSFASGYETIAPLI